MVAFSDAQTVLKLLFYFISETFSRHKKRYFLCVLTPKCVKGKFEETCFSFYQCIPTPVAWYFQKLPVWFHRLSVVMT